MAILAKLMLASNLLIVMTGALVRLSGSGLGCSNWPKCENTVLPQHVNVPTFIEFGNRMVTICLSILAVVLVIAIWRQKPLNKRLLVLSITVLVGIGMQAVLGGLSVLYDLEWVWISAHYIASALLIVPAAMLADEASKARRGVGISDVTFAPKTMLPKLTTLLLFVGMLALSLGTLATGAGPNGGGEGTGDVVTRLAIHGPDTLEWAVRQHGVVSAIYGILILAAWLYASSKQAPRKLELTLTVAGVLVALQGVIGLVQYNQHLDVAAVVWTHVALSILTWGATVWAWIQARPQTGASVAIQPLRF